MNRGIAPAILLLVTLPVIVPGAELEFNTLMMESTFRIEGRGSLGTGFIVAKQSKKQPSKYLKVLITANHVLRDMEGTEATMILHKRDASGEWARVPFKIAIRRGNLNLWSKHPKMDIAAMPVNLPEGVIRNFNTTERLFSDADIKRLEIHPGDRLFCLGFPLGAESSTASFPVLRTGTIASYPLIPTDKYTTFVLEFAVFPGNSGGPVYIVDPNRNYGGTFNLGVTVHGVMGILVKQRQLTTDIRTLYERRQVDIPLHLADVIHARFIRELVEALPDP